MAGVNIPVLIAIFVFYLLILLVGIWAGRKNAQSKQGQPEDNSEVMLAGRNIGLFVGLFTMTATWVGGGYINGAAEVVYRDGLIWCQAPFGYAVSLIVGGRLFAIRMRRAGYKTMLDPFQQHYGPRMGGLLFIPALCGEVFWSAAILAASGATVKVVLDFDRTKSVVVSACIAFLYTLTGGLYSVDHIDVVQLLAIFLGLWLSIPFIMFDANVGEFSFPDNDYIGSMDWKFSGVYFDSMLLLTLGGIPWQVYFRRVLSSKTAEGAELLSYMAAFGCIFMAVPPVVIGAVAKVANFSAAGFESGWTLEDASLVLPLSLLYLSPSFVSAIGLGAVSAAVMSSANSSIRSAASMFAWNIYKLVFRQSFDPSPDMPCEKRRLKHTAVPSSNLPVLSPHDPRKEETKKRIASQREERTDKRAAAKLIAMTNHLCNSSANANEELSASEQAPKEVESEIQQTCGDLCIANILLSLDVVPTKYNKDGEMQVRTGDLTLHF
ncbi:high-affinity choline transporter 1-like [Ornithodoros turicata]|uniref:high-affinity choline transporter 1-like n=1 Tax=Ornithodoros turicata TaxID=34597 RepID=UPI003139EA7A